MPYVIVSVTEANSAGKDTRFRRDLQQRAEIRSQKSEVRSQKSKVRGQKSEVRSQRSEVSLRTRRLPSARQGAVSLHTCCRDMPPACPACNLPFCNLRLKGRRIHNPCGPLHDTNGRVSRRTPVRRFVLPTRASRRAADSVGLDAPVATCTSGRESRANVVKARCFSFYGTPRSSVACRTR